MKTLKALAMPVVVIGGLFMFLPYFLFGSGERASAPLAEPPSLSRAPSAVRDWRVSTPEEVASLPDGRVALCDDQAISMDDCEHAAFLDPDWPVARVLHQYPFFDPEEAAARLWNAAFKRGMFEE